MPRNSSGTYSLYTPGNPVVTNTVISSTWANNSLADIASALTDSLSRTGDGGMQAPLELDNGAIGAPAATWASETTSGLYRASAGNFRFSISSADVVTLTSAGLGVAAALTVGTTAVIGAATGGAQGAGTINATGVYDDGVLLANQAGADPTGTIGLSAVNGAASTFTRSDGAPALSQAIAPTWTDAHIFAKSGSSLTAGLRLVANTPALNIYESDAAADAKSWDAVAAAGTLLFRASNDADSVTRNWLSVARTGVAITTMSFGNATDNPAFSFLGTGATTHGGDVSFTLSSVAYPVGYRSVPRSTTATTLVAADAAKCVAVSAAIAIPASVFSAGDCISIYNDSAGAVNITIAAGTLRLAGSTSTGTRSLAARGIATLWFNVGGATPEVIASGSVT